MVFAVTIWRRTNVDKILTKSRFGRILEVVVKHCITKETIVNGFKTTGLFPFDVNAIDYSKCLGKTVELDGKIDEVPTEPVSNSPAMNESVIAIDLKRFKEIVGEKVFSELSEFDAKERPCSSSFALLHQIYQELSAKLPAEFDCEDIPVDVVDAFETDDIPVFNLDVFGGVCSQSDSENFFDPEVNEE